jgi:hypothetical protein
MILFFGTRLRRRVLGVGTFWCPFCGTERTYEDVRSRTWAHVFWIPLFPLGAEHASAQCTVCHGEWAAAPGPDAGGGPATMPL